MGSTSSSFLLFVWLVVISVAAAGSAGPNPNWLHRGSRQQVRAVGEDLAHAGQVAFLTGYVTVAPPIRAILGSLQNTGAPLGLLLPLGQQVVNIPPTSCKSDQCVQHRYSDFGGSRAFFSKGAARNRLTQFQSGADQQTIANSIANKT